MSDAASTEPLWDATFRARLLRQGLSTDEMAEVVSMMETLDRRLTRAEDALRYITGADVAGYPAHMTSEEVARSYFATRLGP